MLRTQDSAQIRQVAVAMVPETIRPPCKPPQDFDSFGDYIIFVDESGDACLDPISTRFPLLNVTFCLLRKDQYIDYVVPTLQSLKYRYFGHDQVVLHEREMRQCANAFASFANNPSRRDAFAQEVHQWVAAAPFHVVSATIHKGRLVQKYKHPFDPYHIALRFCLERTKDFLMLQGQRGKITQIVFESRGKKEDRAAHEEFQRVLCAKDPWGYRAPNFSDLPLDALFISKQANVAGHQLADQIARPLALKTLHPDRASHLLAKIESKMLAQIEFPRGPKPYPHSLPNAWRRQQVNSDRMMAQSA